MDTHLPCKQAVSNSIFLNNIFSQSITLFFYFREESEYESKWSTDMPSSDALKLSWTRKNAIHMDMAFCLYNSIWNKYESQWYLFLCLYVENAVCLHLIYTATDKLLFPCSYFEKKKTSHFALNRTVSKYIKDIYRQGITFINMETAQ